MQNSCQSHDFSRTHSHIRPIYLTLFITSVVFQEFELIFQWILMYIILLILNYLNEY